MIDKTTIVAKNYFKEDCGIIYDQVGELVRDAYIRGFQRGVLKARPKQDSTYLTNADQFRSMSDEELASFFGGRVSTCPTPKRCSGMISARKCTICWLEWLKQHAEMDQPK